MPSSDVTFRSCRDLGTHLEPLMFSRRIALFAMTAVLGSACGDSLVDVGVRHAGVRVINASSVPFDVLIDGGVSIPALSVATVSPPVPVTAGAHIIGLRVNGVVTSINVQTTDGQTLTTVAVPGTASSVTASVMVDTGSIVPEGKSKLRVVHLASGVPAIEIWRTQPDFQTPVHIMTPFAYLAQSPYLQSDPGAWEVFITAPGSTAKLATTGAISIPNGERRTVVLLDSAGVMRLRVIADLSIGVEQ